MPAPPVLILGAGINGAAIARELVLNRLPVCLVDTADIACGATAYASRLIHGGLRYLEYGEFDLVRESLAERTRLLQLAPQFVKPLRLFIPIENRFGGLGRSIARFLFKGGATKRRKKHNRPEASRGLWLVAAGLRMYDTYARDPTLPRHATHNARDADVIPVDPHYRWLCSYYDAQIRFPERFVLAMLEDARQAAAAQGTSFEVLTYHRAALDGRTATIHDLRGGAAARSFEVSAVVNATGAWVDLTLSSLGMPAPRLMGGTKGSHLVTWNERLRTALGANHTYAGLYAEAADGRPVFVLPFGDATLIGTTDEPYEGNPRDATATQPEIDYLIATVNHLLPQVELKAADVEQHYAGVRPLPYVGDATPASVTRRHALKEFPAAAVPFYSIIGGKLTTCRSLAEEFTAILLPRLGRTVSATSEARLIPGAADFPTQPAEQAARLSEIVDRCGYTSAQVAAAWELLGTRCEEVLADSAGGTASLPGTDLPTALVRHAVRHEWARTLDDLVERRLMLLYHRQLNEGTLQRAAEVLRDEGAIADAQVAGEVRGCVERLQNCFGKRIAVEPPH